MELSAEYSQPPNINSIQPKIHLRENKGSIKELVIAKDENLVYKYYYIKYG